MLNLSINSILCGRDTQSNPELTDTVCLTSKLALGIAFVPSGVGNTSPPAIFLGF